MPEQEQNKIEYIPESDEHRKLLARDIIELMRYAKFSEEESTGEKVFSRKVNDQVRVVVYTSIVGNEVREKDADAIRVCGVYTNKEGEDRGIVKSSRVYRTGKLFEIPDRLLTRMRDVWKKVMTVERCTSCGAPKFMSKKKNLVCCELCYLKKEEK